jgi:hypothetical protein
MLLQRFKSATSLSLKGIKNIISSFLACPRNEPKKGTPRLFFNGLFQDSSVNSGNSPAPYGTGSDSPEFLTLRIHHRPKIIKGANIRNNISLRSTLMVGATRSSKGRFGIICQNERMRATDFSGS